jgi:hypothetical protein
VGPGDSDVTPPASDPGTPGDSGDVTPPRASNGNNPVSTAPDGSPADPQPLPAEPSSTPPTATPCSPGDPGTDPGGQDAAPAPPADPAPPAGAASDWSPGIAYGVGSQITYQGVRYSCRQAHTAQGDWAPPIVPALWQKEQ